MGSTRKIKAVLEAQDRASSVFNKFAGVLTALGSVAAVVGAVQIGRKLVSGMKAATEAAAVQEKAEVQLAMSLRTLGTGAEQTLPHLKAYASALQDITGVGDEVILSNQALLVSVGRLSGEGLERATKAALDMAAVTGNVKTAFDLISKAAAGYTSTLSRYGIIIDQALPDSEKFEAALQAINTQFGGQAAAQLRTYDGRLRELQGRFGDLQEAIGGPLRNVMRDLMSEVLSPLILEFTKAANETDDLEVALREMAAGTIEVLAPVIGALAATGIQIEKLHAIVQRAKLAMAALMSDDEGFKFGAEIAINNLDRFVDYADKRIEDTAKKYEDLAATGAAAIRKGFGEGETPPILVEGPKALKDMVKAAEQLGPSLAQLGASSFDEKQADDILSAQRSLQEQQLALMEEGSFEALQLSAKMLAARYDQEIAAVTGNHEAVLLLEEAKLLALGSLNDEYLELEKQKRLEAAEAAAAAATNMGVSIQNAFGQAAVQGINSFGSSLVDAASGGDQAFDELFKNLLRDMAIAIAQALLLKAILGSTGFGAALGIPGFYSKGGIVPGAAGGMLVKGGIPGRDSVPIIATPGEAVLPAELTEFLLQAAAGGGAGGAQTVQVELGPNIAAIADLLSVNVRRGSARLVSSEVAGTRATR